MFCKIHRTISLSVQRSMTYNKLRKFNFIKTEMIYRRFTELSDHNETYQRRHKSMSDNIIQLKMYLIKHDLKDLVHSSVEETLNALSDKRQIELVNAGKYERSAERRCYLSGHYKRNFQSTTWEVAPNVLRLKGARLKLPLSSVTTAGIFCGRSPDWDICGRRLCAPYGRYHGSAP